MSYARNLLSRGEEVVYESRQHWFAIIARTWIWIVLTVVALAVVIFLVSGTEPVGGETVGGALTIVTIVALIAALGFIAFTLWDWRNQEWLITTRRVMRAEGVLNKSVTDYEPREDQRRAPGPERLRPDLRLRHARHPDRRGGGGREEPRPTSR